MNRPALIFASAGVLLIAIIGALYYFNRPTFVSGDPWTYNLTDKDLPEGWTQVSSNIETAYDLSRDGGQVPAGLKDVHSVQFSQPTAVDVFDITSQVLIYDSVDSAQASFAGETPGDEWETVASSQKVGEATTVWRFKTGTDAPDQATYRIDTRVLNAIVSLTATGTTDGMPNETIALKYAGTVASKIQQGAKPEELDKLGSQPDLRGLLLTQSELAGIDSDQGELWVFNSALQPGWTPNSAFDNPAGMDQLGRLTGYQAWLIKPVTIEELKPETAVSLFEQVTVFKSPENAKAILNKMVGLESGAWEAVPQVGDSAKGWTKIVDVSSTSAGSGAVVSTEISFTQGSYTGSIRVETSVVKEAEIAGARTANEALASQLALALAESIKNTGK